MLVGHAFTVDEIKDAWIKMHPEDAYRFDGSVSCYDEVEKLAEELGLKVESGIYNYYDKYVFGLSFDDMDDDETKKQFMERVKSLLEKAFGDVEVEVCIDGGYDG